MTLSERIRKAKELPWRGELLDEIADEVTKLEDAIKEQQGLADERQCPCRLDLRDALHSTGQK